MSFRIEESWVQTRQKKKGVLPPEASEAGCRIRAASYSSTSWGSLAWVKAIRE